MGNNMFAYCNNNPIRYVDDDGSRFSDAIEVVMINDSGNEIWYRPVYIEESSEFAQFSDAYIFDIISSRTPGELVQHGIIKYPKLIVDTGTGIKSMRNGFLLIATPIPTLADEISGIWMIIDGFFTFLGGIELIWS